MSVVAAFFSGLGVGLIVLIIVMFLRKKKPSDIQRPVKPEPKLTEEVKREIREEIHNDTDRELVERLLRKLGGNKN